MIAAEHDNKTARLAQQLEINCSFNYRIHVVFYRNVIGGNNEATNHSRLMAIKPAHFCNCLINMPIRGFAELTSKAKTLVIWRDYSILTGSYLISADLTQTRIMVMGKLSTAIKHYTITATINKHQFYKCLWKSQN